MTFRLIAVLVVALLFGVGQLLPGSGAAASRPDSAMQPAGRVSPSVAFAQEEDDDDDAASISELGAYTVHAP